MEEIEREEEQEKVPVPVRKQEQKVEQELLEKASEPREQRKMPRRWRTY